MTGPGLPSLHLLPSVGCIHPCVLGDESPPLLTRQSLTGRQPRGALRTDCQARRVPRGEPCSRHQHTQTRE